MLREAAEEVSAFTTFPESVPPREGPGEGESRMSLSPPWERSAFLVASMEEGEGEGAWV